MKKQVAFYFFLILIIMSFGLNCNKEDPVGPNEPEHIIIDNYDVLLNGQIVSTTGFGLGVDDSQNLANWIQQDTASIGIHYPGGLEWGAVFITVGGDPKDPPRPWIDISACTKFSIEMKGTTGMEGVRIGIKDKDDPDDGTETKKTVYLTQDWKVYEFTLSDFVTCDLTKVYVVPEFVFPGGSSNNSVTVDIKNIKILK
nr:hypothetical protein [Bacteroidota bacterium]